MYRVFHKYLINKLSCVNSVVVFHDNLSIYCIINLRVKRSIAYCYCIQWKASSTS